MAVERIFVNRRGRVLKLCRAYRSEMHPPWMLVDVTHEKTFWITRREAALLILQRRTPGQITGLSRLELLVQGE